MELFHLAIILVTIASFGIINNYKVIVRRRDNDQLEYISYFRYRYNKDKYERINQY